MFKFRMKTKLKILFIFSFFVISSKCLFAQNKTWCDEEVIEKVAYHGGDIPLCLYRKLKPNTEVAVNYQIITSKNQGTNHNYDMQIFKSVNGEPFEQIKTTQTGPSLSASATYNSGKNSFIAKADSEGDLDIKIMVRGVYGNDYLDYFIHKGSFIRIQMRSVE